MPHSIQSIDLFVRKTPPDRMSFGIGKVSAKKRRPRAILLVRLTLSDGGVIGVSGDRPSFGWLDKRPGLSPDEKLTALVDLVKTARTIYLKNGREFSTPFALWQKCHAEIMAHARAENHEPLTASYASALFERAVIDAACRSHRVTFFEAINDGQLGIDPGSVHPELADFPLTDILPTAPRVQFHIRHTVGVNDPVTGSDLEKRVNDGEPETLEEYIQRDGLRYFKIKISGDPDTDLTRLKNIWDHALIHTDQPAITLDGNEACNDINAFASFVDRLENEQLGLFQHLLFIEQPLTRRLTHDPATAPVIRAISKKKPLVIDEADGEIDSYKNAFKIGYDGTSHKNCKGVFKSILNRALASRFQQTTGRDAFLTGEDLSNMPIIPLHQDFATLSVLDISHTERNGHHYGFGLSHLTRAEKNRVHQNHPDLYNERDGELFLNIKDGQVNTTSLHLTPGFGGNTLPDWDSLTPLDDWQPWED